MKKLILCALAAICILPLNAKDKRQVAIVAHRGYWACEAGGNSHNSIASLKAAQDLGANKFQTFWKDIFPLSLPGVVSGITLVFLPAVSSFFIPKLLGGGQFFLIGNVIENQFITVGEWNFGSAISMIMAMIMMLLMMLVRKLEERNKEEK